MIRELDSVDIRVPVTAGQRAEQGKLEATPLALEVLTFSFVFN